MQSVNNETPTESFLAFVLLVAVLVPIVLWRAWVLTALCGWYMPSSWPTVTLRTAVGLMFVVQMIVPRSTDATKYTMTQTLGRSLGIGFVTPALSLGFGYLVLWFV